MVLGTTNMMVQLIQYIRAIEEMRGIVRLLCQHLASFTSIVCQVSPRWTENHLIPSISVVFCHKKVALCSTCYAPEPNCVLLAWIPLKLFFLSMLFIPEMASTPFQLKNK